MIEARSRQLIDADARLLVRWGTNIPPMTVPNYAENPDVFDGLDNDHLLQRYKIRSQQYYVLTRPNPSGASAESLQSIEVHIHQIETEITNRRLPMPEFVPVETGTPPQAVYTNEAKPGLT